MASISLVDFPIAVLQLILLQLEFEDLLSTSNNVRSFCHAHPQFLYCLTGKPVLTLTLPQVPSEPYSATHHVFIERCVHVLDGIFEYKSSYCHTGFREWLVEYETRVGRNGIAELIYGLLRPEFIELLVGTLPPTLDQLLAISEAETERFMAVYLLLVLGEVDTFIYGGSATEAILGYLRRKAQYDKLEFSSMPLFLKKMIINQVDFEVLLHLPILRVAHDDANDVVFGDLRVPILLIETIIMVWFRCFKKGGAYEKLMIYSPWSADEICFIRGNTLPSTQLEWPRGLITNAPTASERGKTWYANHREHMKKEAMAYYKEHREERMAQMAVYNHSAAGKKSQQKAEKKRSGTAKRKASSLAYAQSEKGKAAQAKAEANRQAKRKAQKEAKMRNQGP